MQNTRVQIQVPELLAPAGGREQFFAALNCGADAVFLGLREFNARARAENFSVEDLKELLPLARNANMKVLVTLNILIKQHELEKLISVLADLEEVGVDAVIVQDLGVLKLAKEFFPGLRVHASTQLAIHNKFGALEAHHLGFRRIVLARELTKQEISGVCKAVELESSGCTEVEAFCHGSLCYSYSGLCFFSGAKDSRSGNRGECAYTCRKPYKIINEPGSGFLFSMKDLSTADSIEDLAETGVHTLKIEGRKKDAQYVSTVVSHYRKKLDEWQASVLAPLSLVSSSSTFQNKSGKNKNTLLQEKLSLAENLSFGFQRKETTLFLGGRYKENVIDLNNPTHEGMYLGEVSKVSFNTQHNVWSILITNLCCELRLRDGVRLQGEDVSYKVQPQHGEQNQVNIIGAQKKLEQKYHNRDLQFSVHNLRNNLGRSIEEAFSNEGVVLETPEDCSQIRVGMKLFKVRSSKLKEMVEQTSKTTERLRKLVPISLKVAVSENANLRVSAFKNSIELVSIEREFPKVLSQNLKLAEQSLQEIFEIFGDFSVYVTEFCFEIAEGLKNLHFPPRELKELKRELGNKIVAALAAKKLLAVQFAVNSLSSKRQNLATKAEANLESKELKSITIEPFTVENTLDSEKVEKWCAKFDRFELANSFLKTLEASVRSSDGSFAENSFLRSFSEICFEPKKAFLTDAFSASLFETKTKELVSNAKSAKLAVRFAFPTVIRAWDEPLLKKWFDAFWDTGVRSFEVGNLGALGYLNRWKKNNERISISSDFSLYALNAQAAEVNLQLGCELQALSIEDDAENLRNTLLNWPQNSKPQAIVYKDTPLFVAESCSLTALHNGCPSAAVCGYRTLEIENEQGERFFVAHENCKSIVYAKEPFSLSAETSKLRKMGIRNFRVDFLTREYTLSEVQEIVKNCMEGKGVSNSHSANFNRVLL